ncbi:MAG: hypothetical protein AAF721_09825 [Myxococcota bacterium]
MILARGAAFGARAFDGALARGALRARGGAEEAWVIQSVEPAIAASIHRDFMGRVLD